MACIEFNFGGTVISTNLDITDSLNANEIIAELKNNPNNVYTIDGEEFSGNLYEVLVETLKDEKTKDNFYYFQTSKNIGDSLIGNTSISSKRFPHLNSTDNNIFIGNNIDISRNYFFSENRMFAIGTNADKTMIENLAYIYNELKNENMAWIRLINQLLDEPVNGNIYTKLEYLANVQPDKLLILSRYVPSENASVLLNNQQYELIGNKWFANNNEIVDEDLLFELWTKHLAFIPTVKKIKPIEISEIEESLSYGDILVAVDDTILEYNFPDIIIKDTGVAVANNTKIKGYLKIKNKNLRDYLFTKNSPVTKLNVVKLDAIVRGTVYDFAFDADGMPTYTFHNKPTKIQENGIVAINNNFTESSNPCLLYIPIIFNHYLKTHPGIKFTINGEDAPYNTVLKELLKYSNFEKNHIGAVDNIEDISKIFTEISRVSANGSAKKILDRNIAKLYSPKTIKTVSEDLIKKLISENKLINYCKI